MDTSLRHQILRAAVRDRTFLKAAWHDIQADDFPEREERIVAEAAIAFYEKYEEPVGSLLRSECEDLANRDRFGTDGKKKLHILLNELLGTKMELVPVKALEDRVKALKKNSFYSRAAEEVVSAFEQNKFSVEILSDLVEKAHKELSSNGFHAIDFFDNLQVRIERRKQFDPSKKLPLLAIDPLDEKICGIGRGHFGMVMAPASGGKGHALNHIAVAYAMQGLKVLLISLEDGEEEVLRRLDACMAGIPMNKLHRLPIKLKKRLLRVQEQMRGQIRIIDGTEGGWTVGQIERVWHQLRQDGFTADAIIVDYDDEIECEKQYKGESARRFEFAEIYRRLRRLAAKLDVIVWTAAQSNKMGEGKKVLTAKDIAEDYSKVRKTWLAIGIGGDPKLENTKYLYVMRHRLDRSRFGVEICCDYGSGIFYDRDATLRARRLRQQHAIDSNN
jgi:replicative DNA helicase